MKVMMTSKANLIPLPIFESKRKKEKERKRKRKKKKSSEVSSVILAVSSN